MVAKSDHGGGTKLVKWVKGKCVLCGGEAEDVSRDYFKDSEIKKGLHAHQCKNCGYLGKEIDEFA